ncbi:MAG: DNA-binding protein [Deltaproteobacteria bacterium GWC2_56_8]|nr:MAG: DNA-binding protein [Deltaproteobacteria bacterium GWB2_55_19]OGP32867.1 MAG: DNA-binding protein [Deltaproteobacteria bacterium GWC2_56_8]HAO92903.1 DNA-binding protein [Deltaproteobacteria bacterium]
MAKAMTKSQIEDSISKKTGIQKKGVKDVLAELSNLAYQEAPNSFTIPGIGKLVLVNRPARTGRNPRTGEAIQIPDKQVVKFRIAKACKDAVLKK